MQIKISFFMFAEGLIGIYTIIRYKSYLDTVDMCAAECSRVLTMYERVAIKENKSHIKFRLNIAIYKILFDFSFYF
ncbi:hypothetical protein EAL2_c20980 [Peptoclostridium acidaminophilum DSM 3953]|uniref:Uncharacterized protein n=1 Tax=Peptoclostridium acidaminophilum DSM 3953 TaxID=1286171 RepID=W8T6K4_PEPAC|nr:hypothetical protein EAL2_c20980 [Peptoclostridium acidaminophilum DSM 3953]